MRIHELLEHVLLLLLIGGGQTTLLLLLIIHHLLNCRPCVSIQITDAAVLGLHLQMYPMQMVKTVDISTRNEPARNPLETRSKPANTELR